MAWRVVVGWLAIVVLCGSAYEASTIRPVVQGPAPSAAATLVSRYCVACHNDRTKSGDLSLQGVDIDRVAEHAQTWEKVARRLRADSMPPIGRPRPEPAEREALLRLVEGRLDAHASAHPNPGRTAVFHRLNRNEYQNAVRDLLGVDTNISDLLPADGQNFGFDNIGDALSISPMLLDRYLSVSRRVSRLAVGDPRPRLASETFIVPSDLGGQDDQLEGLPYGTRGGLVVRHHFPQDGDYEITVRLMRNYNFQVVDLNEPHEMEVLVDDEALKRFTVAPLAGPRVLGGPEPDDNLKFRVPISGGRHTLAVTFVKRPSASPLGERLPFIRGDAKLNALHGQPWLAEVTVVGPYNGSGVPDTPSRARVFTCRPASVDAEAACARQILTNLARRAYRRPLTPADLEILMKAFEEGRRLEGGFDRGIELALHRLLVSPSFLFRIERDPPSLDRPVYQIDDYALASRLSFFLWSSLPDDQLLDTAASGRLREPATLERQVRRMLADPRAAALTANFAGQWLELRRLQESRPDQQLFPNVDGALKHAFRRETELLVDSIVREDRPLIELLTADYTFVNERLARHYGIDGVYGDRFRRVMVQGSRRGLLGHGSVLTVTSYGNRTSPVLRGVWILNNLLGTPPPPPPPNVPDLGDTDATGRVLSMRERMVLHRKNPTCASCHSVMDPLGLSLENFDAVGVWRVRAESGELIDAKGALPNGAPFEGVDGLRRVLVEKSDVFYQTLTEKLMIYALGRNVEQADAPAIRAVMREAARNDFRAQSLVLAIARSLPFQMKRAADSTSAVARPRQPVVQEVLLP